MNTATLKKPETKAEVEILEIEPAEFTKSSYRFEGADFPLDRASLVTVPSTDNIVLKQDVWFGDGKVHEEPILAEDAKKPTDYFIIGVKGDLVKLQYIRGYSEIYVPLQEEKNIIPSDKGLRGKQKQDSMILIKDGYREIRNEGLDIGLFRFLKKCNYNGSNLDRDETGSRAIFREKNAAKALEPGVAYTDMLQEATNLLYTVRDVKSNTFDSVKLNHFSILAGLPANLKTPIERWSALMTAAKKDPKLFLATINTENANYISVIVPAFELNLLFSDDTTVFDSEKHVVITSETKMNKDQAIDKLVEFYSTKGATDFDGLKTKVKAAQKEKEPQLN